MTFVQHGCSLRKFGGNSQRMVVFPALSRPKTSILASLSPNIDIKRDIQMPILSSLPSPVTTRFPACRSLSDLSLHHHEYARGLPQTLYECFAEPVPTAAPLRPMQPLPASVGLRISEGSAMLKCKRSLAASAGPSDPSLAPFGNH